MENTEIYKNRLKSIYVYNGYLDAADKVESLIRGKSVREIQDVLELWTAWHSDQKWFNFADKVSARDWYKKSLESEKYG